ncbi:MAG: hypothetical protein RR847_04685 [Bacilli bacterium]
MLNTAIEILKEIENKGFKAYIVGGYPRDIYLNRQSVDIDICTSATPKQLKKIFENIILPLEQYGAVVIKKNKFNFEITTFRKDLEYQDNRKPLKVVYVDNIEDDLKRRDFTINALCINSSGETLDLIGAINDLNSQKVKAIGNPRTKLKEDSLRILRAIRFATILDFKLDDELKKYIKKYGYLLKKLSIYRRKEELNKIFSSPNCLYGLKLIKQLKLDKYLSLSNVEKVKETHIVIGIWAQLDVLETYEFSRSEKNIIKKINELMTKDVLADENLYYYGLYISSIVGDILNIDRKIITKKYNSLYIKCEHDIALKSAEICTLLNRRPGPFLKPLKKDLEIKLINKEIVNNRVQLEQYIIKTMKDPYN